MGRGEEERELTKRPPLFHGRRWKTEDVSGFDQNSRIRRGMLVSWRCWGKEVISTAKRGKEGGGSGDSNAQPLASFVLLVVISVEIPTTTIEECVLDDHLHAQKIFE